MLPSIPFVALEACALYLYKSTPVYWKCLVAPDQHGVLLWRADDLGILLPFLSKEGVVKCLLLHPLMALAEHHL